MLVNTFCSLLEQDSYAVLQALTCRICLLYVVRCGKLEIYGTSCNNIRKFQTYLSWQELAIFVEMLSNFQ